MMKGSQSSKGEVNVPGAPARISSVAAPARRTYDWCGRILTAKAWRGKASAVRVRKVEEIILMSIESCLEATWINKFYRYS